MTVTTKQADYWKQQMAKGCPEIGDAAALRFKAVRAFSAVTADNGIGLRLLADDGDAAEVFLNPVVAERLLRTLVHGGQAAGWLDDHLKVNVASA